LPALHELQREFVAALFAQERGDDVELRLASAITEDGIEAGLRLDIYRNNLHEGFRKALTLEFPVIERLVGEGYFRQLSQDFLAAHPSRGGDLHYIGERFADFLEQRFCDTQYAYLPDVARLEWAIEESAIAAHADPFDVQTLRQIGADEYGKLRFTLHPTCRLVRSAYPVMRIWESNQSADSGEIVDVGSGGEYVLVHRQHLRVELDRLSAAEYTLLEALAAGFDLSAALETVRERVTSRIDAAAPVADFDLGAALRRFISVSALARVSFPDSFI
jgi:hypothetical protein